jgi:ketosteroid isomerase-like protein
MRQLITFLLLAIVTACQQPKIDQKAEGEKLMQVSRDWAKSLSADSIDRVMSFWADSAMFVTPDNAPLYGKAAIRKMVEQSFKTPGFKITWEPVSASISDNGDMGYLIEKSEVTVVDSTGKPMTLYGQVVTIWKKDADGNWKNVVDITVPDYGKNK